MMLKPRLSDLLRLAMRLSMRPRAYNVSSNSAHPRLQLSYSKYDMTKKCHNHRLQTNPWQTTDQLQIADQPRKKHRQPQHN